MGTGPSRSAVWDLALKPKVQVFKDVPQSKAANNAAQDCLRGWFSRLAPLNFGLIIDLLIGSESSF